MSATTPALLIIAFKRPSAFQGLLDELRRNWSGHLYISIDGASPNRPADLEKQRAVVKIAQAIDWVESKELQISDRNFGCRFGPIAAIDWFFSRESEGIILEEDCIPGEGFIDYCRWALAEFRSDKRIWHISGNNFSAPLRHFGGKSCAFIPLAQVWGWATWSDRWKHFIDNPFWVESSSRSRFHHWNISMLARWNKLQHLEDLKEGLDTWDYQWQCCVLNHGAFAVVPATNQISNIGDGPDATHTKHDARMGLETEPLSAPLENYKPELNTAVLKLFEEKMNLRSPRRAVKYLLRRSLSNLKLYTRAILSTLIFAGVPKIVVSSSGRCGSTLLTDALAMGLVKSRYAFLPEGFQKPLARLAVVFASRLERGYVGFFPITKTHDTFKASEDRFFKYVFVFGDPLESALSVLKMRERFGQSWVDEHFFNLGSKCRVRDLLDDDVLCYERQLSSWSTLSDDILCVHYEDLWDFSDIIGDFTGIKCELPARTERTIKDSSKQINGDLFLYLDKKMLHLRDRSQMKYKLSRTHVSER